MQHLSIKNWAAEDRPREKLLLKGVHSLSDAELIAIILGSGSKTESALDLAKRILSTVNNNLQELSKLTVHDLLKFKGIGQTRAISLISVLELGKRRSVSDVKQQNVIQSSKQAFELINPYVCDLMHEEFWVIYLRRNNSIIDYKSVSKGGISGTVTDTRIIIKLAIELLASGIILVHNHPSGNKKPSESDISITKKISAAAQLVECSVLDHVIISNNTYFSFADEGIL